MKYPHGFNLALESLAAGLWEWDIIKDEIFVSPEFHDLLGYETNLLKGSLEQVIKSIAPVQDHNDLKEAFSQHIEEDQELDFDIQLLTKEGYLKWFRIAGKAEFKAGKAVFMAGALLDIDSSKKRQIRLEHLQLLADEVADLAIVGGWEVDLETGIPIWSKTVYDIHELPYHIKPTLEDAINFHKEESRKIISQAFEDSLQSGEKYDLNLEITTAKGNDKWVRTICQPLVNKRGKITRMRGIFQDVTQELSEKKEQEKMFELVVKQRDRLEDYAHMTSHNLRNHLGNLEIVTKGLANDDFPQEVKEEFEKQLPVIVSDFANTLNHISKALKVQSSVRRIKESIDLYKILEASMAALKADIELKSAKIDHDLSLSEMKGTKAYMISIFTNLISNALRFSHPERTPEIQIHSYYDEENKKEVLIFKDNGIGIDLELFANKIFGLYHTFHEHIESRGVGLFMVKNQVEALDGSISVESEVNQGTTFKIELNR